MLSEKQRDITILCDVVDNFGDIGFCYRLARSLSEVCPEVNLRLIVSDLASFAKLEPKISSDKSKQDFFYNSVKWTVFDWNNTEVCKKEFLKNPPMAVLQCFQCKRPEWLEEILFDKDKTEITHIINVEYLTAEDWADEFHCLKSGTRSKYVKKVNFMPGFTNKTGGLVLDNSFMQSLNNREYAKDLLKKEANIEIDDDKEKNFNVVIFSYERDFTPVVKALCAFEERLEQDGKKLNIFVADGKAKASFQKALDTLEKEELSQSRLCLQNGLSPKNKLCLRNRLCLQNKLCLKFLSQRAWDALLTLSDFNFVRGEDSMARACLCGVPFVWHAYPQENEWQTVKVKALMKRLESYFSADTAKIYTEFMCEYNRDNASTEKQEELLKELLFRYDELKRGSKKFASEIISIGNLAENLCIFISHLQF